MRIFNKKIMKDKRHFLRNEPTEAEKVLWNHLKNRSLGNLKFRRQHSMDCYIVDFYCPEKRLVVEVDGNIHNLQSAKEYDVFRDEYLRRLNIRVLRVTNDEVMNRIDAVLGKILNYANTPNPE